MATVDFTRFLQSIRQSVMGTARRRVRQVGSTRMELLEGRVVPTSIIVAPHPDLVTTEAGVTAQFDVTLGEQPTKDVTVSVKSDNSKEGKPNVTKLKFDSLNWDKPQTVIIKGVDDKVSDGDKTAHIVLKASNASNVLVSFTNRDDDFPRVIVTAGTNLQTTEAGGKATFNVRLNTAPTADVVIPIRSTNTAEGTVSVTSLTFTKKNFNKPQTVTITGVDDTVDDGDQSFQIEFDRAQSADSRFNNLETIADVTVTNLDNDSGTGPVVDHSLDGQYTGEATGKIKPLIGSEINQTVPVEFSVDGDTIRVTKPDNFTGKISDVATNGQKQGTFDITSGPLKGATFTGGFTKNPDGSITFAGTWSIKQLAFSGSGTISATRPAP